MATSITFPSVPPSPNRISFSPTSTQLYTAPSTPICKDSNEDEVDFKFETSQESKPEEEESFPAMAFADELFCNGRVVPLKPPPRLQYVNCHSHIKGSLKSLQKRESKEFDPFMAALEKVRSESNGTHRRTKSVSPLSSPKGDVHHDKKERNEQNKPALARPVSCKGSSCYRPVNQTVGTISKGSNRVTPTPKGKSDTEPQKGQTDLRNLSFKAIHKAHYGNQKALVHHEIRRRTVIPYKAQCMLVCLGFGQNGLRDLN